MKKTISLILAIFIFMLVVPVYAETQYPLVSVTGSLVNVRSGPSLNYKILYQVVRGTLLERLSKVRNSSGDVWYRVYDFNTNRVVYIASWLTEDSGVSVYGQNADFTAEVNTDVLNARIGPGTSFKVIDVLSKGEKKHITRIIIRSDGQKWFRYKEDGRYYYVAGWYMKKVVSKSPQKTDNNSDNGTSASSVAKAKYYINIRYGPSLDYGKKGLVTKGDTVSVDGVAKNKEGELWIEIEYNGTYGWCYAPLFDITNLPSLDLSPIGGKGDVIDYVNLRSGPSTDYSVETVLPKGTSCQIVGVAKNEKNEIWYQVLAGKYGWVRSDLITLHTVKKGQISKITWEIASNGINVVVLGKDISRPQISILENPIRINARFSNTLLNEEANALLVNIPPIVRVRFKNDGFVTDLTVDLTDRIPFKAYFSKGNFVINLELPKKGQKRVKVSDSLVYASTLTNNGSEYICITDIFDALSLKYKATSSGLSVDFFGKNITVKPEDLYKKDGNLYVSFTNLMKYFNVIVSESNNTVYIDPVLISYEGSGKFSEFVFSMPPKIKKEIKNGKTVYVIYASAGNFSGKVNFVQRKGEIPPMIFVSASGEEISVNGTKVSVQKGGSPGKGILSGRIIVIDPGHGSYSGPYLDTGATGPTGVKEAVVVLEIAKLLAKLLEADGAKVILTHTTLDNPNNPTLAQRCAIANSSGGDLFMSIHLNASVSREAHGTETYYWYPSSKKLAEIIQHSLVTELGTTDRGVKRDYLYVCRNVTTMPAILTEVVFVSNPHEEALCKEKSFLEKVAKALRDGIVEYLTGKSGG